VAVLVVFLPLVAAAIAGFFGRAIGDRGAQLVTCGALLASMVLGILLFRDILGHESAQVVHLATWIAAGGVDVEWSLRLDTLSGVMILVVTIVSAMVHVYSVGYMAHDKGIARFMAYLSLFTFFMLALVTANDFVQLFFGWEGVGLCSYLLIGYWYEKKSAADAGKKAFITNRVGDWGFVLGVFLIYMTFGTFDFRAIQNAAALMPFETAHFGVLSFICLFLFVGATGKSAQIPLYVWLPDAMEGPTPVSALIHAATMVTAGVYMLGRNAVLLTHAPQVMTIVAIVGVLTALMAASIGLVQYDIKKVLAYSTVSQLGYMFTAVGVGAFSAGAFHLMTHAFFKALLFLGSGSVIHAMGGEQDMRRMGNLKKYMPVTFATMMIGTLAIAGIPPFAGFFSKDEILFQAFLHNKVIWVLAVATALMTAFYMWRLMAMTFFGAYRGPAWETGHHADVAVAAVHGVKHPADPHAHGQADKKAHEVSHGPAEPHDQADDAHAHAAAHGSSSASGSSRAASRDDDHGAGHGHGPWHGPHESPSPMTFPLQALAIGAIVAGFIGIPAALGGGNAIEHFLEPSFTAEHVEARGSTETARPEPVEGRAPEAAGSVEHEAEPHVSRLEELGLMALSVAIAVIGIGVAQKFYVKSPEVSEQLAERFAGAHRLLSNKYYVDELYNATVISGTFSAGDGLWAVDRTVVDGAVNGAGRLTVVGSWFSGLTDRKVVDGLVNLVGWIVQESSLAFRRFQTGLVQNYALLMLFGIFVSVGVYLFVR
jgi:NADH-quinone oxidoreductase subunit L